MGTYSVVCITDRLPHNTLQMASSAIAAALKRAKARRVHEIDVDTMTKSDADLMTKLDTLLNDVNAMQMRCVYCEALTVSPPRALTLTDHISTELATYARTKQRILDIRKRRPATRYSDLSCAIAEVDSRLSRLEVSLAPPSHRPVTFELLMRARSSDDWSDIQFDGDNDMASLAKLGTSSDRRWLADASNDVLKRAGALFPLLKGVHTRLWDMCLYYMIDMLKREPEAEIGDTFALSTALEKYSREAALAVSCQNVDELVSNGMEETFAGRVEEAIRAGGARSKVGLIAAQSLSEVATDGHSSLMEAALTCLDSADSELVRMTLDCLEEMLSTGMYSSCQANVDMLSGTYHKLDRRWKVKFCMLVYRLLSVAEEIREDVGRSACEFATGKLRCLSEEDGVNMVEMAMGLSILGNLPNELLLSVTEDIRRSLGRVIASVMWGLMNDPEKHSYIAEGIALLAVKCEERRVATNMCIWAMNQMIEHDDVDVRFAGCRIICNTRQMILPEVANVVFDKLHERVCSCDNADILKELVYVMIAVMDEYEIEFENAQCYMMNLLRNRICGMIGEDEFDEDDFGVSEFVHAYVERFELRAIHVCEYCIEHFATLSARLVDCVPYLLDTYFDSKLLSDNTRSLLFINVCETVKIGIDTDVPNEILDVMYSIICCPLFNISHAAAGCFARHVLAASWRNPDDLRVYDFLRDYVLKLGNDAACVCTLLMERFMQITAQQVLGACMVFTAGLEKGVLSRTELETLYETLKMRAQRLEKGERRNGRTKDEVKEPDERYADALRSVRDVLERIRAICQ